MKRTTDDGVKQTTDDGLLVTVESYQPMKEALLAQCYLSRLVSEKSLYHTASNLFPLTFDSAEKLRINAA